MSNINLISLLIGAAVIGRGHLPAPAKILAHFSQGSQVELAQGARSQLDESQSFATRLVASALGQVGRITDYDEAYRKIPFPNGDVPSSIATNADLIVRAYRGAGLDLQARIFQDKSGSPWAYPANPRGARKGSTAPDPSMDHRHVPTLSVFLARKGRSLPITRSASDYKPGDIITCRAPDGRAHVALVVPSPVHGKPWIVHNLHWGPRIEDKLFEYTITGHYRYLPGM